MSEEKKILITLDQLKNSILSLPNPVGYGKPSFDATAKGCPIPVHFERVKISDANGKESAKWSYKGRIIIENPKF